MASRRLPRGRRVAATLVTPPCCHQATEALDGYRGLPLPTVACRCLPLPAVAYRCLPLPTVTYRQATEALDGYRNLLHLVTPARTALLGALVQGACPYDQEGDFARHIARISRELPGVLSALRAARGGLVAKCVVPSRRVPPDKLAPAEPAAVAENAPASPGPNGGVDTRWASVGLAARIDGLALAQFNGRKGVIIKHDGATGRWIVRLDPGEDAASQKQQLVSVKPANLFSV